MNFHHLLMQLLPGNRQAMTDENEKQAIVNELSASQDGVAP